MTDEILVKCTEEEIFIVGNSDDVIDEGVEVNE